MSYKIDTKKLYERVNHVAQSKSEGLAQEFIREWMPHLLREVDTLHQENSELRKALLDEMGV